MRANTVNALVIVGVIAGLLALVPANDSPSARGSSPTLEEIRAKAVRGYCVAADSLALAYLAALRSAEASENRPEPAVLADAQFELAWICLNSESLDRAAAHFDTWVPRFSPDGRWIAYASREDGTWKIYLKTFPLTSRKWQISDRDAFWYNWDPSGGRIYFQWSGTELFATTVDLTGATPVAAPLTRRESAGTLARSRIATRRSVSGLRCGPPTPRFVRSIRSRGEKCE